MSLKQYYVAKLPCRTRERPAVDSDHNLLQYMMWMRFRVVVATINTPAFRFSNLISSSTRRTRPCTSQALKLGGARSRHGSFGKLDNSVYSTLHKSSQLQIGRAYPHGWSGNVSWCSIHENHSTLKFFAVGNMFSQCLGDDGKVQQMVIQSMHMEAHDIGVNISE